MSTLSDQSLCSFSAALTLTKVLLGVVYILRNSGFWYKVEKAFVSCNSPYDFAVVLGDFNVDWRSNSTPRKIFADFLPAAPFHLFHLNRRTTEKIVKVAQ